MNRKLNFMANLLLTAAVAVSCSRSDEPVTGSDRVEVRFSANTAEIRTRVTETGWTAGDPVGIYMIRADPGTLAPENIVEDADNRQYKADGGAGSVSFTPVGAADAIYYPMSGNVEFIAYYPYTSPLTGFKLPVDVSNQASQSAIDVLYAPKTNGGYNKSAAVPVDLQFSHKLVKLAFTIEAGDGVTESLDGLTVKITGQQTEATLNLADETLTPEGAASAITANTAPDGSSSEAIVLPAGSVSGMTFTFTTAAGGAYEVAVPDGSWAPGKKYTYEVTLKRNEANITGSVAAWGDGGSETVAATPQIAIEGYAGNIDVLYTDAPPATVAANDINRQSVGSTLKSITLVDHNTQPTYLIGRVVDPDNIIRLKFDKTTGDLLFRDASADGSIPIGSYAEFQLIYDLSVQGDKYRLEADLDLMNEEWRPITDNTAHTSFYGEFDGAGKKISNLRVTGSSGARGLFRANRGTIRNVHIFSGTIIGVTNNSGGGVCGDNSGQIISCSNGATVSGSGASYAGFGGVVGTNYSDGAVTACYNTGVVSSGYSGHAGGVVGNNYGLTVACYNTGAVSGTNSGYIGGVVGSTNDALRDRNHGLVTACYNTGTVSGTGGSIGGVAGRCSDGAVTASYNTGAVSGTSTYAGGVVGENYGDYIAGGGLITACYNTGAVSGGSNIGGIAARNSGEIAMIAACYWKSSTAAQGIALEAYGSKYVNVNPFTDYFNPGGVHAAWGTGAGEENGYWKAGTTDGSRLPQLWYE